jgi:uncharacterized protein involved in exopolysaccharide biosynthesis
MKETNSTVNVLRPFYRGLPIVILVIIVAEILIGRYLKYATPMYESTAKIKLADPRLDIPSEQMYKNFDFFATMNNVGTEVEVLKSRVLIEKAMKNLDLHVSIYRIGGIRKRELYDESPFKIIASITNPEWEEQKFKLQVNNNRDLKIITPDGEAVQGFLNQIMTLKGAMIKIELNDSLLHRKPDLAVNDNYEFVVHNYDKLTDKLSDDLDVMAVDKEIAVLRINYKSAVPQKSADIVNAVAEAYIRDYIETKYKSADTTVNFLEGELKGYTQKLSSSEDQLEQYRDANRVINLNQESETDLRKLSDQKKELATLEGTMLAIDSLYNYLKKGSDNYLEMAPNFQAFNDLLSTEMMKEIKRLQAERHELVLKYTVYNDKIIVLDKKIKELYAYIVESVRNTQINTRIRYKELQNSIAQGEHVFDNFPSKEKEMRILERNFTMNEQIFRFLHEKKTDAEIARAATISFHRIITPGEVAQTPVSPNAPLLKAFGGFMALLFAIFGIYFVHFMKGRVSDENVIYKNSDTPISHLVPNFKTENEKNAFFAKWALELNLSYDLENMILTISSMNKAEGKRTNASGLAEAIFRLGKKVLYVSADGRMKPDYTNFEFVNLQDVRENWRLPNVWQQLTEKWLEEFDVVIIQNFAFNEDSSSLMLMNSAFVNFYLLDSRKTKKKSMEAADDIFEKLKPANMSFVLNRAGYTPTLFAQFKQWINRRKEHA